MSSAAWVGKPHVFSVTLRRHSANVPWGIRIVGGSDTGSCFIITRVSAPLVGLPQGNIPASVLEELRSSLDRDVGYPLSVRGIRRDRLLRSPLQFISQSLHVLRSC
jgi:hypothetical protein